MKLRTTNRPLSCHQCRQRKVACDKIFPCKPCQYSGLTCSFPSGRKESTKTANSELLRRIARLEQLILRSGDGGQGPTTLDLPASQSPSVSINDPSQQSEETTKQDVTSNDSPNKKSETPERFVGHSFLRSLATEASPFTDQHVEIH